MTTDQKPVDANAEEARKWAMFCHLSALLGLLGNGVGFVLGPLLFWMLKREVSPFVDEQGKEALNFQITMFIGLILAGLLSIVLIGIPLLIVIGLAMIILPVIGAVQASSGEHYRYPFTLRLIK